MDIEVLISTMNIFNKKQHNDLLKIMNVKGKSLVINQCPNNEKSVFANIEVGNQKIFSFNDKGLSKSRNIAIKNSSANICLIADDDLTYVNNYIEIIDNAFKNNENYDIIAFYVENAKKKDVLKAGKVNFIHSLKLCSVQLAFKRKSIIENEIFFDESFGAGSGNYICGEENIFLSDCLKRNLKILYVPIKIATLNSSESTWFKGYNKDYFITKGAVFYRLSELMSTILILQFAIRKYKLYKNSISFFNAIKYMYIGKKKQQNYVKIDNKKE